MKAISLWQPWASAIALGFKTIETRSWQTWHTGPIAIHAAKRWTEEEVVFLEYFMHRFHSVRASFEKLLDDNGYQLPLGCIVAVADLEECVRTDMINSLTPIELALGNYTPGRYGWILRNIKPLAKPIPCKGRQGIFNVEI